VRVSQGFFSIQQTCPSCQGRGVTIEQPCPSCSGRGRIQRSKTLAVKVPAGVDEGDRVRPHPIFERHGADLSCVIPISFATAALGGSVDVPTLEGQVTLKIPLETQSGKVFRLRGKGIRPVRSSATGDLYCRVDVEVPVALTAEQKRLLKAFNDSLGDDGDRHRPRARSWKEGVRRFFENIGS
jgi:molecular chaperone DnaJ